MWRYQDAENYYVVRMNPSKTTSVLYKVVAGKRISSPRDGHRR